MKARLHSEMMSGPMYGDEDEYGFEKKGAPGQAIVTTICPVAALAIKDRINRTINGSGASSKIVPGGNHQVVHAIEANSPVYAMTSNISAEQGQKPEVFQSFNGVPLDGKWRNAEDFNSIFRCVGVPFSNYALGDNSASGCDMDFTVIQSGSVPIINKNLSETFYPGESIKFGYPPTKNGEVLFSDSYLKRIYNDPSGKIMPIPMKHEKSQSTRFEIIRSIRETTQDEFNGVNLLAVYKQAFDAASYKNSLITFARFAIWVVVNDAIKRESIETLKNGYIDKVVAEYTATSGVANNTIANNRAIFDAFGTIFDGDASKVGTAAWSVDTNKKKTYDALVEKALTEYDALPKPNARRVVIYNLVKESLDLFALFADIFDSAKHTEPDAVVINGASPGQIMTILLK